MSLSDWLMLFSAGAAWAAPLTALSIYTHGVARSSRVSLEGKIDKLAADQRADHQGVREQIAGLRQTMTEQYVRRDDLRLEIGAYTAIVGEMRNDIREVRRYVVGLAGHVGFKNGPPG